MSNSVQTAVGAYVRAWSERDAARRLALLDGCFAANGRFVTRRKEICGRAGLAEEMARLHGNRTIVGIRLVSPIDAGATTFRIRAVADFVDGTSPESLEVGEVDRDGRIVLVLTFTGPFDEPEAHKGIG